MTLKTCCMKKEMYSRGFILRFPAIMAIIILMAGCQNSAKKQEGDSTSEDLESMKEEKIEELAGYPVPTSYDLTELIQQAGAPYILTLSNDPGKSEDYITQRDKALNLGIYGTDLCYATTYMMKQSTILFLESSKNLIDDLGISTTFNSNYAERVEDNIDDRDSLIQIVSDSFYDTWNYLVNNKQDVLARLVVCGSWIEGIYITTNIAMTSADNTEFLEILGKQKKSLNTLVNLLEPVKDVDEITDVFKGLFDLRAIYEGVTGSLTDDQLEEVGARIETLRMALI